MLLKWIDLSTAPHASAADHDCEPAVWQEPVEAKEGAEGNCRAGSKRLDKGAHPEHSAKCSIRSNQASSSGASRGGLSNATVVDVRISEGLPSDGTLSPGSQVSRYVIRDEELVHVLWASALAQAARVTSGPLPSDCPQQRVPASRVSIPPPPSRFCSGSAQCLSSLQASRVAD